ncbi:hypothetical protein [Sphaerisporangium siamense]|uniref:Uncharacterized protein n=1 Tax=Sphaerisporangium siamense TaxID=795645 RepID=A0A7W7D589_9ACTN|nr:hypothetical protein [Sphaerisporangium siamense]MBB4700532.1 hypothetical protein [Sphaerisporangium siamense]
MSWATGANSGITRPRRTRRPRRYEAWPGFAGGHASAALLDDPWRFPAKELDLMATTHPDAPA